MEAMAFSGSHEKLESSAEAVALGSIEDLFETWLRVWRVIVGGEPGRSM